MSSVSKWKAGKEEKSEFHVRDDGAIDDGWRLERHQFVSASFMISFLCIAPKRRMCGSLIGIIDCYMLLNEREKCGGDVKITTKKEHRPKTA